MHRAQIPLAQRQPRVPWTDTSAPWPGFRSPAALGSTTCSIPARGVTSSQRQHWSSSLADEDGERLQDQEEPGAFDCTTLFLHRCGLVVHTPPSWDRLIAQDKFKDMDYLIPTVSSDFTGLIPRPGQADRTSDG